LAIASLAIDGASLAAPSMVVLALIVSSVAWTCSLQSEAVTVTGTISPANNPAAVAAAAISCERAASSSSLSRVRPYLADISSADMPCPTRPSG
jgi:hypothetical protein